MNLKAFNKPLLLGIVAVVVVIAAVGARWGYSSYREHSLRQAVVPQVQAADERLRAALGVTLEPEAAQAEQVAAELEAAAQDIEARLAGLRALDAAPDPARVEAAEQALGDASAIVRKQADVVRAGLAFTRAREALAAHMRGARTRRGAWVNEAIELKHKLDKAYFEYKFTLDGLGARLGDVPDRGLAAVTKARIDAALDHAKNALAQARRF